MPHRARLRIEPPEPTRPFIGLEVFRRFVREHPALYRIAYQRIVGLSPSPGLTKARRRAYIQLQQRVARLRHAGLPTDKSIAHATLEVIAMFEGLANAELRGDVLRTIPPGEEERAWREGRTTVLQGMIGITPRNGPPRSPAWPEPDVGHTPGQQP